MKIFKYNLPIKPDITIQIPSNSKFLSLQVQDGIPVIWFLVYEENPLTNMHISVYGTGQEINQGNIKLYIGTIQVGSFVWHFFENKNESPFPGAA